MKIKWYGHAAFLITSNEGIKIIVDPYKPGEFDIKYGEIKDDAHIVLISHDHLDHNYTENLPGNPLKVGEQDVSIIKGINFKRVASKHGMTNGENLITTFPINGITIGHLGDLGYPLKDKQLIEIGEIDVLMIPVGGVFTLDHTAAHQVVDQINPKVVLPMHYTTEHCPWTEQGVSTIEPFLDGEENWLEIHDSEIEINKYQLPEKTEIWKLAYANR